MRSSFAGLNTMLSGIQTYSLGLDTVGHNITNAKTNGYSRQSVDVGAVRASKVYTSFGASYVGNGAGGMAINRARDAYADKQYWRESSSKGYYETQLKNYNKIEEIFNDSGDNGLQNAMTEFYQSWVDLSANASITANRTAVIEKGRSLAERIALFTQQTQQQINMEYEDLKLNVDRVNAITDGIVALNKSILTLEANGANANDIRDQRDLLVDELSAYMNINVYEDGQGMYSIVSNGTSIVNGISGLHLQLGNRVDNEEYGITDYTLQIQETGTLFNGLEGILKGNLDNVVENKGHIDTLANIACFLLTTMNDQHRTGVGIDKGETTGRNFYGEQKYVYTWEKAAGSDKFFLKITEGTTATNVRGVKAIAQLHVSGELTKPGGEQLVAARTYARLYDTNGNPLLDEHGNYIYADGNEYTIGKDKDGKDITVELIIGGVKEPYKTGDTVTIDKDLNGTGDGSNATLISTLFNLAKDETGRPVGDRAIGDVSLNTYYNASMTGLGIRTETTGSNLDYEESMLEQINTWRESTSGVNWNEELTYMIAFQQGYTACSRCLTTMDEMLDRLVNSTGVVGR